MQAEEDVTLAVLRDYANDRVVYTDDLRLQLVLVDVVLPPNLALFGIFNCVFRVQDSCHIFHFICVRDLVFLSIRDDHLVNLLYS